MRRLFHGRMITVDGHMRRMSENYNKFAIVDGNKIGSTLLQALRGNTPNEQVVYEPSNYRNSCTVPCKPNTVYRLTVTKPNYYVAAIYLTEGDICAGETGWAQNSQTLETGASITGLSISICKNTSLTPGTAQAITVGDCGLIITEE